jgi:hypothetical protein
MQEDTNCINITKKFVQLGSCVARHVFACVTHICTAHHVLYVCVARGGIQADWIGFRAVHDPTQVSNLCLESDPIQDSKSCSESNP